MPQIPVYEADDRALPRPNTEGFTATLQEARRQSQMAGEIGREVATAIRAPLEGGISLWKSVDDVQSSEEIARGTKQLAEIEANNSLTHQRILANTPSGTDVRAVTHAMQEQTASAYNDFLEGFSSIGGRRWAQEAVARAQAHESHRATAEAISSATDATLTNVNQTLNIAMNRVYNNPAEIDHVLESWDRNYRAVMNSSPLTPEARSKLMQHGELGRQQILLEGIHGMIRANPEAGFKFAQQQKYWADLPRADIDKIVQWHDSQIRADRADARAARIEQHEQRRETSLDTWTQLNQGIRIERGPDGHLIERYPENFAQQLMDARDAGKLMPEQFEHLMNRYEQRDLRVSAQEENETFRKLTDQLLNPPAEDQRLTPEQVQAAFGSGKLNHQHTEWLLQQLKDPRSGGLDDTTRRMMNSQVEEIKGYLFPEGRQGDPQAASDYKAAYDYMLNAVQNGLRRGLTPQQLLDKASPDYIFKNQFTPRPGNDKYKPFDEFKGATPQVLQQLQQNLPAGAAARNAASGVDTLGTLTNLMRSNNPQQVQAILEGNEQTRGKFDVTQPDWRAKIVDQTIASAGLTDRSQFSSWGFPIDARYIQKGDLVQYRVPSLANTRIPGAPPNMTVPLRQVDDNGNPLPVMGMTDNQGQPVTGIATGRTRITNRGHGELQVEIIDPDGQTTWADPHIIQARRARPTPDQIGRAAAGKATQ